VDGAWRDHQLLAVTADEVGAGLVSRLIQSGHARLP
jgi:hypothetical protein